MRPVTALIAATAALSALAPAGAAAAALHSSLASHQSGVDVRRATSAPPARHAAQTALLRSLGPEGVVTIDPLAGTPDYITRLNGALTAPSAAAPTAIALGYIRSHAAAFGLDARSLAQFKLSSSVRSTGGITHLVWQQRVGGLPVFGAGLTASVARDGRLLVVGGAPLAASAPVQAARTRRLGPTEAIASARADAGTGPAALPAVTAQGSGPAQPTSYANGDQASLVAAPSGGGARVAWQVLVHVSGSQVYQELVDAATGAILQQQNLVRFFAQPTPCHTAPSANTACVWDYGATENHAGVPVLAAPGVDPAAYTPHEVTFPGSWGVSTAPTAVLSGRYATSFSDLNDNDLMDSNERVVRGAAGTWERDLYYSTAQGVPPNPAPSPNWTAGLGPYNCTPELPCTWDSDTPYSWKANRVQTAVQAFYFVNNYRDWLAQAPISFNQASGNFDRYPEAGATGGKAGDPISVQVLDGASGCPGCIGGSGQPDPNYENNANFTTLADGTPGKMQMYLFSTVDGTYDADWADAMGSDDASVVYHEYTHGLSSRLITYPDGYPALWTSQASAMGEGWSDWYATDYLVEHHYMADPAGSGNLLIGPLMTGGHGIRTMPMDCPVGSGAAGCVYQHINGNNVVVRTFTGGYTYGDYGRINGAPEPHDDGEIWGQTLWQLRGAVGAYQARALVTEAMRLSPAEPSFIDMRNMILAADTGLADTGSYGPSQRAAIWQVFASRGMGLYASTASSVDVRPVADFTVPDSNAATGDVTGVVRNSVTGKPVSGARVTFAGQGTPGAAGVFASSLTDATGTYHLSGIEAHAGLALNVQRAGFDTTVVHGVTVPASSTAHVSMTLRRNWAARAGAYRSHITAFTGPDYSGDHCGPGMAVDQSPATGWVSDTGATPPSITLRLGHRVNVSAVGIDPGSACDTTTRLRGYRVETSRDGAHWTLVRSGRFTTAGGSIIRLALSPMRRRVLYVRFTMLGPQRPALAAGSVGLTELGVYGRASG